MKIMHHIIKIILFLSISSVGFGGTLELENNDDGTWNIKYVSEVDIGGFQFDVDGVTVNSASGGATEEAGFMVTASSNRVIGFSLSGATIPAGNGILIILELSGEPTGLSGIVIPDSSGNSINFTYIAPGCTDENACNYNANANINNESLFITQF